MRFSELANDALEYSRLTKVADAYRIDRWHMITVLSWFRDRSAGSIAPQDIERRLNEISERGRKPATVSRYRALLSLVYSLAIRNGKFDNNPVRQVRPLKENNERVRFLEDAEEALLRKEIAHSCPDRESEFDLALHTGMRRGEQYRLHWQDVDLKRGIITVPRSKHGESRHIQLNSIARGALLKLRQNHDGIGYVCPGFNGPRSRDWRHWFEDLIEKTKIPNFRWHDLRHTFANRLVMAGVQLRAVQTLLGPKRMETTTLRYSHPSEPHLHEAVERLAPGLTDTKTRTAGTRASARRAQKTA